LGLKHTAIKIIKEANTGKLLGAHVLYPQAEDLINLFSMALKHNLSSGQIKETILTYPSDTSDIKYLI
jgi:glutathione reductase (NADPH)